MDQRDAIVEEKTRIQETISLIRYIYLLNGYWLTKDFRKIKITEMEDSHLINTYNMITRKNSNSLLRVYFLREILERKLELRNE